MGASADTENQGKTVVDINLVPLGEKFDNTTAMLIYQRFQHRKVPLNMTLFSTYEVIYISSPGDYLHSSITLLVSHIIFFIFLSVKRFCYQGFHLHHHMGLDLEVVQ